MLHFVKGRLPSVSQDAQGLKAVLLRPVEVEKHSSLAACRLQPLSYFQTFLFRNRYTTAQTVNESAC